ncbi:hypothetical protein BJY00DRAFT_312253 [Aspergillus carlsbadensis]|nr:hypothetical protein BJY00DRAFT_312253 [Aspergillus carlsbadensis]
MDLDPDSLEYALTKNSRFLQCYQNMTLPTTADCSSVRTALENRKGWAMKDGVAIMSGGDLRVDSASGDSFGMWEWCAVVICVKQWGYKVVPSTPRDAAMLPTLLRLYTQTAFVFLGALYQFHGRHRAAYRKESERCKGLGEFNVLNWLIHAWDLASWVWWWITFAQFAMAPNSATAPFVLGWVTPWKYYSVFAFHPYSCVFHRSSKTVKSARWLLYLLAAAQWCATCYVLHLVMPVDIMEYGTRDPYPSYDCDASRIPASPGTTTCSADRICNKTALFIDAHFVHGKEILGVGISSLLLLTVLTAIAAFPIIRGVSRIFRKETLHSTPRENVARFIDGFRGMTWFSDAALCYMSVCGIMVGGFAIGEFVARYRQPADTLFKIDWECGVVHVFLSQWRYYLDIGYRRGVRIAQMWFSS